MFTTSRRRARPRRGLVVVLLLWLGLADYDEVFGQIFGFWLRNIGGILSVLSFFVDPIIEVAEKLWHLIELVFSWAQEELYNVIYGLLQSLYWFWQLTNGLISDMADALRWITSKIHETTAGVWDWLQQHIETWVHAIIDPFIDAWHELENRLGDGLDWLSNLAEKVWQIIEDGAGWIWDRVNDLIDIALAPLRFAFDVVEHAIDWLVWLAEHPFDWFIHLADNLFRDGKRYVMERLVAVLESEGSAVEDWLMRLLGD